MSWLELNWTDKFTKEEREVVEDHLELSLLSAALIAISRDAELSVVRPM